MRTSDISAVSGTQYRALGTRFQINCQDETTGERVRALLRPLRVSEIAAGPQAVEELTLARHPDGAVTCLTTEGTGRTFPTDGLLLDHLQWYVNFRAIEELSRRGTGLHATGLQRGPVTLLCPADSEAGKSTLAATMVKDGWTYLSDEAIECDPATGHLVPYPKAITLDVGAQGLFPEARPIIDDTTSWYADPDTWGWRAAYTPAVPTAIVLPRYHPGADLSVRTLSPGAAVMALAPLTFHFGRRPEHNLHLLGQLARNIPVLRLTYGGSSQARRGIEAIVGDGSTRASAG